MIGDNEKSQPQELLEEVIGITHGDTPEFPTLEEQAEYWREKDAREEPAPLKHLCRAAGYNCDRRFASAQALRMHIARVHTKTILAPKELNPNNIIGRPVETLATKRKWSLARRRAFNKKKREESPFKPLEKAFQASAPITVTLVKFCPYCGEKIERFLA